jgi:hypothetical protein
MLEIETVLPLATSASAKVAAALAVLTVTASEFIKPVGSAALLMVAAVVASYTLFATLIAPKVNALVVTVNAPFT